MIRKIRDRTFKAGLGTSGSRLRVGIGDDCALLHPREREELAITTDLSIAGRHFRLDWHSPESVGHRTLARGLSDLAAMGARPIAAFLSLGLPVELAKKSRSRSWFDRFLDGFLLLAKTYKTPLAGGDLSESPVALADIILIGAVSDGKALLRSTARPGDAIYVTGTLGGSAAALVQLQNLAAASAKSGQQSPRIPLGLVAQMGPHLAPQPRVAQGLWLQRHSLASAAMDLSDGLSMDMARLCNESGVNAEIEAAALPIHPAATLDQALHGGEDYELLFTAAEQLKLPHKIAGVPITKIGRIMKKSTTKPQIGLVTREGLQTLPAHGWEHFSQNI